MDTNKRLKLIDIGYRILNTCGSCVSFRTNGVMGSGFGSCTRYQYMHLKQGRKDLSVHRSGTCPEFEAKASLEGFEEFRR